MDEGRRRRNWHGLEFGFQGGEQVTPAGGGGIWDGGAGYPDHTSKGGGGSVRSLGRR